MNFGNIIYEDIEQNEYLNELYENLLFNYSIALLQTNDKKRELNLEDLLAFADILSKSNHPTNAEYHKVWGQEIASLAKYVYPNNFTVDYYLNSILSTNGNYRGLDLMGFNTFSDGFLGDIYNEYSKKLLEIPADTSKHFFKAQKRIYSRLEDDSFSFSGPTSMDKSFIMRMFIKEKIVTNLEVVLVNKNNQIMQETDIVGTGTKVQIKENGNLLREYKIIVYGDANGDGKINSVDLLVLQRHILEIERMEEVYQKACNIRKDGKKPSSVDLLLIQRHILKLQQIEQ